MVEPQPHPLAPPLPPVLPEAPVPSLVVPAVEVSASVVAVVEVSPSVVVVVVVVVVVDAPSVVAGSESVAVDVSPPPVSESPSSEESPQATTRVRADEINTEAVHGKEYINPEYRFHYQKSTATAGLDECGAGCTNAEKRGLFADSRRFCRPRSRPT